MPNTPAAVGQGISALIGNSNATRDHLALTERLMASVGQVVHLDTETQMDAVTGVSGSGPAYVFHLIETLAAAGIAEGTAAGDGVSAGLCHGGGCRCFGAGQRLKHPSNCGSMSPAPNGTTQAALEVLMDPQAWVWTAVETGGYSGFCTLKGVVRWMRFPLMIF